MKRKHLISIILILWMGSLSVTMAQSKLTLEDIYEQELYAQQNQYVRSDQKIQSIQNGDNNQFKAIQCGTNNCILNTQTGDENKVFVQQSGIGNNAIISQNGDYTNAKLIQDGDYNQLFLSQNGTTLWANILQKGNGNTIGNYGYPLTLDQSTMLLMNIDIQQLGNNNNIDISSITPNIPKELEIKQIGNNMNLDIAHFSMPIF